jgi:hypothetical protein
MNLEEFKKQMDTLSAGDGNQSEIEDLIRSYFIGKAIPHVEANYQYLARARPNNQPGELPQVFSRKDQLLYPPNPDRIPLGRANYKGEQVFYGAMKGGEGLGYWANTALMEVSFEYYVKDLNCNRQPITLSRWTINRPLFISVLPFSKKCLEKNPEFKKMADEISPIIETTFSHRTEDERKSLIADLEYISDLFCDREKKPNCYKISAAYYHVIREMYIREYRPIDGLLYPSACTDAAGMNIVLDKSVVDSKAIELDLIQMVTMQRAPNDPMHLSFPEISKECIPDSNGRFNIGSIW